MQYKYTAPPLPFLNASFLCVKWLDINILTGTEYLID